MLSSMLLQFVQSKMPEGFVVGLKVLGKKIASCRTETDAVSFLGV